MHKWFLLSCTPLVVIASPASVGFAQCMSGQPGCRATPHYIVCTPPPLIAAPYRASLDDRVRKILRRQGIVPGAIPTAGVSLSDPQVYAIAYRWSRIQDPLEKLFQRDLRLEVRPKLFLVLRQTGVPPATAQQFVISDPGNSRIVAILSRELALDRNRFDPSLKLYGETSNFETSEFRPEFLSNTQLNLAKIQGALRELLQSDKSLADMAKKVNGSFKPINTPGDLTSGRMYVITEWQKLAQNESKSLYWRASITLEQHPLGHWVLETLIDIGERYRSQGFDRIQKITDSNRLIAFDTIDGTTIDAAGQQREGAIVRYKTVRSPNEQLLSPKAKAQFAELAPAIWNKVKRTILVVKLDAGP